jgi:FAD/FMN-containing dehydrogenase
LDVVTVDGDELFIDDEHHSDLYWAARVGAGGFPAIATRFHLDLHPLPKIRTRRTRYSVERLPELLAWSAGQRYRPPGVEISLLALRPPDDPNRPAAVVQTTTFGPTEDECEELIRDVVDDLPCRDNIVDAGSSYEVALNTIESAGAWVEGRRYAVDMAWVADGYEEIGRRTAARFAKTPSHLTRVVFAWDFSPELSPEVAQTRGGELTVNVYSIWGGDDIGSDASNERWTRELMAEYEPWIVAFYAGEADLLVTPDRAQRSYSPDKWTKLEAVRRQYDPDGVKFGFINEP